jgi:hypothetical protein
MGDSCQKFALSVTGQFELGLSNNVGTIKMVGTLETDWRHFALGDGHAPFRGQRQNVMV